MLKYTAVLLILFFTGCITTKNGNDKSKNNSVDNITEEQKREVKDVIDFTWDKIYKDEYIDAEIELKSILNNFNEEKSTSLAGLYRARGITAFAQKDDFEAFDYLIDGLLTDSKGAYSGALATFISSEVLYDGERHSKFIGVLKSAVEDETTPKWLKREYQYILNSNYQYKKGDIKNSKEIKNELNIISDWEIIGPFPNVSSSGYKNDFLLLDDNSDSGLSEIGTGINNWKIDPYTPSISNTDLYTPISRYFGSEAFISIYAHKKIEIGENGTYEFVFSRKGSIEIWLDGEKLVEDNSDTRGNNSLYFKKELKKGKHSLLVKSNKLERSVAFNASFAKIKTNKSYEKSKLYITLFPDATYFDPLINEICNEIEKDKTGKEGYFWLNYTLLNKGWLEQARTINYLIGQYGKNGDYDKWFDAFEAELSGDTPVFDKKIMELAEQENPFAPALQYAGNNYIKMARFVKAEEFITQILEKNESWYYALYLDLLLNLKQGNDDRSIEIYEKIKELYPGIPTADLLMLRMSESLTKDRVNKYIKELRNNGEYQTALYQEYLYSSGTNTKIILKKYIDEYSLNLNLWMDYISLQYEDDQTTYKSVKDTSVKAQKTFPLSYKLLNLVKEQSGSTYKNLNAYYTDNKAQFKDSSTSSKEFMDEMSQEKKYYKSALEKILNFYPYSVEVRDELRQLTGKKEFLKELKKRDSYDLIEEFESSVFKHSQADAVVVYDNQREISFGDGASTYLRHYILKVLTPTGIENNRFINLGFNPSWSSNKIYEAFTLKQDGTRVRAENSGYELAYSRLSPGDYIVVSYRTDDYLGGKINKEIFTKISLASVYPIFQKNVQIIYPKTYKLNYQFNNIDEADVNKYDDVFFNDYDITTFRMKMVQAVEVDNFTPSWRDSVPNVEVSSFESWDTILNWYTPLYLGQTIPTLAVKDKAMELCDGAVNDDERIKRLFNFVANKIEYEDLSFQYDSFIPQTADSILKEGFGDCKDQSVLLISLLNAVGINSHMALNATYFNGKNAFLPSNIFDHAIVAVKTDGKTLYLDPTLTYYTFGEMPEGRRGTYLLDITEGGTFHKADYDIESQKSFSLVEISNINSSPKVKGSIIYQGSSAWNIRRMFKDSDDKSKRRDFTQMMNIWYPGFKLEKFDLQNYSDIFYDPKIDFSGDISTILTKIDNKILKINSPWKDLIDSEFQYWLGIEDRGREIGIPRTSISTPQVQVLVIDIPPGHKIYNVPQNRFLKFNDSYINFKYENINGKIICSREMFVPQQIIISDEFDDFKEFIESALHLEKENIYLTL